VGRKLGRGLDELLEDNDVDLPFLSAYGDAAEEHLEGITPSTGSDDDLKLGILVATTGFDLPNSLDFLPVNDAGRTTIDGIRSWDEGDWSHTFTFAADATDGQILGWSHVWSSD